MVWALQQFYKEKQLLTLYSQISDFRCALSRPMCGQGLIQSFGRKFNFGQKFPNLNSRFSKFTMGIWLCEWLRGQNFETAAQKIIIWKFWGNIFTVCFYFDRQMTVRIIEPQFKKEREFQKFIKKIFTQPNCHCKHKKIWV